MPIRISQGASVVLIRREAFEKHALVRSAIDARYGLAADEFRVEEDLVVVGPLASDDVLAALISDLENEGLVYFDEFFELSGNWPGWLTLYARAGRQKS